MEEKKKKIRKLFEEYLNSSSNRFKFNVDYQNWYITLDDERLSLDDFASSTGSVIPKPERRSVNKGSSGLFSFDKYERYLSECYYIEGIFETINSLTINSRKYIILSILFKNEYALKKKLGFINVNQSTYYYHYARALNEYIDQSFLL